MAPLGSAPFPRSPDPLQGLQQLGVPTWFLSSWPPSHDAQALLQVRPCSRFPGDTRGSVLQKEGHVAEMLAVSTLQGWWVTSLPVCPHLSPATQRCTDGHTTGPSHPSYCGHELGASRNGQEEGLVGWPQCPGRSFFWNSQQSQN